VEILALNVSTKEFDSGDISLKCFNRATDNYSQISYDGKMILVFVKFHRKG
jgi:hypothetical protein